MGWISYFVSEDDKHFNRKTELDRELWRNNEEYYKLVKSAMVGSTYYAAYEHIPTKTVYGLVCLTSICRDIYGQIEFYYKTIEENMGPNEANAPKAFSNSFLQLMIIMLSNGERNVINTSISIKYIIKRKFLQEYYLMIFLGFIRKEIKLNYIGTRKIRKEKLLS